MAKRWYIVHAYSNFENKVAQSIKDQAAQRGLEDKFDEVMVPTEKVVEVRRGRKVDTERKFFPGYVLVKCDLTDEVYHLIKNTPKVTGFLGADKSKPVPIPDREAERIKGQVAEGVDRPKPSDQLRGRRAGPRLRRALRLLQRRRRGGRRGPGPPQGGGVHLRPRHAGRTRIRSGREGLIVSGSGTCLRDASQVPDRELSPREVCPVASRELQAAPRPATAMPLGWRRAGGPLGAVLWQRKSRAT